MMVGISAARCRNETGRIRFVGLRDCRKWFLQLAIATRIRRKLAWPTLRIVSPPLLATMRHTCESLQTRRARRNLHLQEGVP